VDQFVLPLFSKGGGDQQQDPCPSFRPKLGKHDSSLDRFPKPHLIRQNSTLGQRGLKSKERRLDLMWIHVHLRVRQRSGKLLNAVSRSPLGEFISKVFGLMFCHSRAKVCRRG